MPWSPTDTPLSGDFDAWIMLQSHFYTAGKAIYITLVRAELSFPLIMKKNTEQSSSDVNQLLIQAVILLQRQYLLAEHLVKTIASPLRTSNRQ